MSVLKLRMIGNSVGLVLPKPILTDLNVNAGQTVHLDKFGSGYLLRTSDSEFDRKVEAARYVMKKRFEALRELAK